MNLLAARGRFDEALAEGVRARALDPLSVTTCAIVGWVLIFMRDYERAVQELRTPLEMDPTWVLGHLWSAWPKFQLGQQDEAIVGLEKAMALWGNTSYTRAHLALGLAVAGREGQARLALAALREMSSTRYVSSVLLAMIETALGDRDAAFVCLQQALRDRDHWLVYLDVDSRFDPLRGEPRFEALRRSVGLAPDASSPPAAGLTESTAITTPHPNSARPGAN